MILTAACCCGLSLGDTTGQTRNKQNEAALSQDDAENARLLIGEHGQDIGYHYWLSQPPCKIHI
jgi:hypothetical protein